MEVSKIECPECSEFLYLKYSDSDIPYFKCNNCEEYVTISPMFTSLDKEDLLDSDESILS